MAFEAAAQRAGFGATLSTNIDRDLWTKFVRLATWSGMTTVARSPMGVIRRDPALMAMMASALDEAIAVGRALGIPLAASLVEETVTFVRSFPDSAKSSMLEDLENGRRLELPWLSGAVCRMGREAGVSTPIHQFITTVLAPFVAGRGGGAPSS
jgi:2-dehydropantoate 2-reductase